MYFYIKFVQINSISSENTISSDLIMLIFDRNKEGENHLFLADRRIFQSSFVLNG